MVTKGSQRRLARFFLSTTESWMRRARVLFPSRPSTPPGSGSSGGTRRAPRRAAPALLAVAREKGHGGRSGGEAWAARYPKESAPAAESRATELPQSPPAGRQLGSVGGSFPKALP